MLIDSHAHLDMPQLDRDRTEVVGRADIQITVLSQQIRLARDLGLPVVIHDREAHTETLKILREEGGKRLSVVIHCFSRDLTTAERCLEIGYHISVPGTITFPKANEIREVIGSE